MTTASDHAPSNDDPSADTPFSIAVVSGHELTYAEAYRRFFEPNLPFVVTGLTNDWPACTDWVAAGTDVNSRQPNWPLLAERYGESSVSVVDCSERQAEQEQERCFVDMQFKDVVDMWKKGQGEKLYIKDWHLAKEARALDTGASVDKPFYRVPQIFQDDWMDNYYRHKTDDDFAFVYFGRKGTFTPLHRDVYTSYSWSANVLGRKEWHFIRPEDIRHCRRFPDSRTSQLVPYPRPGALIDVTLFPDAHKANIVSIVQEEGSIIFVPSNWYHFVENLDDFVISINHNWCNATNLPSMYRSMCEEVADTEEALSDVKQMIFENPNRKEGDDPLQEWITTVQDIVEKNAGWSSTTFFKMITFNLQSPSLVDVPGSVSQRHSTPSSGEGQAEAVRARLADILQQAQQRQDCSTLAEIWMAINEAVDALAACTPA